MSTVFVHVGQCGNQIGQSIWSILHDACHENTPSTAASTHTASSKRPAAVAPAKRYYHRHFHRLYYHPTTFKARCILVDSEPKVIRSVIVNEDDQNRVVSSSFQPAHVHYEQSGRGNNWAMGYNFQRFQRSLRHRKSSFTSSTGNNLIESAMESLQSEVEAQDVFEGTMLTHSLGGGTGAGLGCRLMESMRDAYPKSYLMTTSIAPSMVCGDTPLQNYNAVFTLSCLQEHADMVVLKDNDDLLRTATYWKAKQQTDPSDSTKVGLQEMNAMVAADLVGLIFPRTSASASTTIERCRLGNLIHDLAPLPTAKFVDIRTAMMVQKPKPKTSSKRTSRSELPTAINMHKSMAPSSSVSMDNPIMTLSKLARQTLKSFSRPVLPSRCLGSYIVVRYDANASAFKHAVDQRALYQHQFTSELNRLCDAHLPLVAWSLQESQRMVQYADSVAPFDAYGARASITVASNHGHAYPCAQHFRDRARKQFHARAYTHWYHQYGVEDAQFEQAFDQCTQLMAEYEQLLR